jgi:hypothetical protein
MNYIKSLRKLLLNITDSGTISLVCSCDSGNPNDYKFIIKAGYDDAKETKGYEKLKDAFEEAKQIIVNY